MTPEAKKFLIRLGAVALVGWIAGNWLLGPPGLSSEYREQYQHEHEHYLEIIKSKEYKVYRQRPHLVDLSANPELQDRVAFVESYVNRAAFQEEQHRIHLYSLFFEIFNAGLVVALVLRFARKPLHDYLSEQIESLREKMNQAARSRESALARRTAAEEQIANLHEVEMKLADQTERRLERELHELATANHYRLGVQERELAERKRATQHNAEIGLKKRLVDGAIEELVKDIRKGRSDEWHAALLEDFVHDVEAKR